MMVDLFLSSNLHLLLLFLLLLLFFFFSPLLSPTTASPAMTEQSVCYLFISGERTCASSIPFLGHVFLQPHPARLCHSLHHLLFLFLRCSPDDWLPVFYCRVSGWLATRISYVNSQAGLRWLWLRRQEGGGVGGGGGGGRRRRGSRRMGGKVRE